MAASLLGAAWGAPAPVGPGSAGGALAHTPVGAEVRLEGWLEVELDGGSTLHLDGEVVPLILSGRAASEGRSGTAVSVVGRIVEGWHPRARRPVRVEALERWRAGGVEAPGVPPLARWWAASRIGIRDGLRARIRARFPDHAGLVAALLLADRSALPFEMRDAFTRAGTAHLLAISGFHVGVLAGWVLIGLAALRVPHGRRPMLAAAVVWSYVAVLGFPTSAVRAALLVTAASLGRARGRPVHPLGAWGLALAVVSVADPGALRGPGAQLSFAGSLGLILWARRWGEALGGARPTRLARRLDHLRHGVGLAVAASAAAQVATLPFVAWHFQRVPLVGLPASVLATPPIAVALPGILLTLLLDTLAPALAAAPALGVSGLLDGTATLIAWLADAGPAAWVGPSRVGAALAGGWLGGRLARRSRARAGTTGLRRAGAHRLRGVIVGAWVGVGLAPVVAGVAGPRGMVEIHLLDVGQGDAIAIRSPRGAWVLVDAGPGPADALLRQLARRGVSRLETVVLTHPDLDHVGGAAELLRSLRVERIVSPALLRGTEALRAVGTAAAGRGVPWAVLEGGERWELDGLEFAVLHAGAGGGAPNDHSVVLHLRYGDFDALLTGDVTSRVEDELPARLPPGVRVEVLKVAHHGSTTSTSEAFLDRLAPGTAVVSVGRRNRFGHPAPPVLRRFERRGIPLHRTDEDGAIRIRARRDGGYGVTSEYGAARSGERRSRGPTRRRRLSRGADRRILRGRPTDGGAPPDGSARGGYRRVQEPRDVDLRATHPLPLHPRAGTPPPRGVGGVHDHPPRRRARGQGDLPRGEPGGNRRHPRRRGQRECPR